MAGFAVKVPKSLEGKGRKGCVGDVPKCTKCTKCDEMH